MFDGIDPFGYEPRSEDYEPCPAPVSGWTWPGVLKACSIYATIILMSVLLWGGLLFCAISVAHMMFAFLEAYS